MADAKELAQRLSRVDVFSGLQRKELHQIAAEAREIDFEPGHEITTEGKDGVAFHLILDGNASVSVGGSDRAQLGPGDYFGEISLIDGKPRTATIRATGKLRTAAITGWNFRPLLQENPSIAVGLLEGLCARLRTAESEKGH